MVDSNGKVDDNFAGEVTFTLSGSSNAKFVESDSPSFMHTFTALGDEGQYQVEVKNDASTNETVSLIVDKAAPSPFSNSIPIDFVGVDGYLVFGPNQSGTTFTEQGLAMNFTLRAAEGSNIVRSYNKTATFSTGPTTPDGDAFITGSNVSGNVITFVDGIAEFTLNNNVNPETFNFEVKEVDNPSTIQTGEQTAIFQSSDNTPPEIVRVEMDTPWIVHVYFNEDVDSVTASDKSNYSGTAGAIDKVCWYGDNVTLNLAATGTLGGTFNLTVDNVQDTTGNPIITSEVVNNITIPDVDFQGVRGAIDDWFEIQASKSNPAVGETIHITVYHKNVCGYLTGSNNVNKNTTLGTVGIVYGGSGTLTSPPGSVDMSSGQADFDITILTAGQITISVSETGVTTEILTLN